MVNLVKNLAQKQCFETIFILKLSMKIGFTNKVRLGKILKSFLSFFTVSLGLLYNRLKNRL